MRASQKKRSSRTLELLGAVWDEPQRQTRVGAAAVARNDQIAAARSQTHISSSVAYNTVIYIYRSSP